MIRKEAEKLIGSRVAAWTAANGVYSGTLIEIHGRPWRGKVLIQGVIEPAQHFERGAVCRKGFRPGETIDVGGSSIRPTSNEGVSYLLALETTLCLYREREAATPPSSPSAWVWPAFIRALECAIKAENQRLTTGKWEFPS